MPNSTHPRGDSYPGMAALLLGAQPNTEPYAKETRTRGDWQALWHRVASWQLLDNGMIHWHAACGVNDIDSAHHGIAYPFKSLSYTGTRNTFCPACHAPSRETA